MDIKEGDEESDDDGAGDERGAVEGGGRSRNVASAGQYAGDDEEFEDAMEEAPAATLCRTRAPRIRRTSRSATTTRRPCQADYPDRSRRPAGR